MDCRIWQCHVGSSIDKYENTEPPAATLFPLEPPKSQVQVCIILAAEAVHVAKELTAVVPVVSSSCIGIKIQSAGACRLFSHEPLCSSTRQFKMTSNHKRVTDRPRVEYYTCWTGHCQAPTSRPRNLKNISLEMHLINISAMLCAVGTKVTTDIVLLVTQSRMKCQRRWVCLCLFERRRAVRHGDCPLVVHEESGRLRLFEAHFG
eukprot:6187609-Pleurochrysis_carterae.AAC.3